jgi:hypothetical protein
MAMQDFANLHSKSFQNLPNLRVSVGENKPSGNPGVPVPGKWQNTIYVCKIKYIFELGKNCTKVSQRHLAAMPV